MSKSNQVCVVKLPVLLSDGLHDVFTSKERKVSSDVCVQYMPHYNTVYSFQWLSRKQCIIGRGQKSFSSHWLNSHTMQDKGSELRIPWFVSFRSISFIPTIYLYYTYDICDFKKLTSFQFPFYVYCCSLCAVDFLN